MKCVLQNVYENCYKEAVHLNLSPEALEVYKKYHDDIVDYRKSDLFEEARLSVKSKSLGLLLRLSGVICFLRMAASNVKLENLVEKTDIDMAMNIVNYSVANAFSLLPLQSSNDRSKNIDKVKTVKKTPLSEPENLTIGCFTAVSKGNTKTTTS